MGPLFLAHPISHEFTHLGVRGCLRRISRLTVKQERPGIPVRGLAYIMSVTSPPAIS